MSDIRKRLKRLGTRVGQGAEQLHPISPVNKTAIQAALAAKLEQELAAQQSQGMERANSEARSRLQERLNEGALPKPKDQSQDMSQGF